MVSHGHCGFRKATTCCLDALRTFVAKVELASPRNTPITDGSWPYASNGVAGRGAEAADKTLAELAFYSHIRVSLASPLFHAELVKLDEQAKTRGKEDFTLTDMKGKSWHLKGLAGRVVLVPFWATWCPPCQREMASFQTMHRRFANQGLLILAFTGEGVGTVRRYMSGHPISFNVLLDPNGTTQKRFLVDALPHSLLYNREGKLVAQIPGPPTAQQLLDTLGQAGLK